MSRLLHVFVLLITLVGGIAPAQAQTRVATGASQDITVGGVCKTVTNACAGDVMVPSFDSTQFTAIPTLFGLSNCANILNCGVGIIYSGHVATAHYHSCAISTDGTARCVGESSHYRVSNTVVSGTVSTFQTVSGGYTWASIASTGGGNCGLRTDGVIMCWGSTGSGETGTGSTGSDIANPTVVSGGYTWLSLAKTSAARNTMCAIRSTGAAYCWGNGGNGNIGDGGTSNRSVPTLVSGGYTWKKIAVATLDDWTAANATVCGIRSDDAMMCWGGNANYQLGDGTTNNSSVPVLIPGGYSWKDVSVGKTMVCGVRTDGAAMCWGTNTYGQLGDGTTTTRTTPTLVNSTDTFRAVFAGTEQVCGIVFDGSGRCWGFGTNGQLGNGGSQSKSSPVTVSGGYTWKEFAISAASGDVCAISTNGNLYCWGYCSPSYYACTTNVLNNVAIPTLAAGGYTY